jgi:putative intracellular protease/amidase
MQACRKVQGGYVGGCFLIACLAVVHSAVAATSCGNVGTEVVLAKGSCWRTQCYVRDSGVDGPTVAVIGGVRGNEPAGVLAADQIRHWPIRRGKLIVLPRANQPALKAGARAIRRVGESHGNLKSTSPRRRDASESRGELAEVIRNWLRKCRPDWIIELREGAHFHRIQSQSLGGSVTVCSDSEAKKVAAILLDAVNATIDHRTKRFVRLERAADGRLTAAITDHLGAHALTCETTTKSQPCSCRTRQHRIMVHRLLGHLDMLHDKATVDWLVDRSRGPDHVAIALYDAKGTGGEGVPRLTQLFSGLENVTVVHVGPHEMRTSVLSQFDVVIFPGGYGSRQARAIGARGRSAVARFVKNGGGYLGICAGAYLATSKLSWGLRILDAKPVSSKWVRGKGMVEVEVTSEGRELLGWPKKMMSIRYQNGPILTAAGSRLLPDYKTLAYFRTEVAANGAERGVMVNSPAIVAGPCGKGRVICFSPHAEGGKDEAILVHAVHWLTDRRDSAQEAARP